jgi:hypothetical protein
VTIDVPDDIPETMPEEEPIVATPMLELLHVPPPLLLKVVVKPSQTDVVPVIAAGNEFTFNTVVVMQPVGKV